MITYERNLAISSEPEMLVAHDNPVTAAVLHRSDDERVYATAAAVRLAFVEKTEISTRPPAM